MNNTEWYVDGIQFGVCNCAFGCPCQFESLPTEGDCRGFELLRIDHGHFGDIDLSDLSIAMLYAWPGPIFEGRGELQAIIDQRAGPAQREALDTILRGGETEEGATHWWVFCEMSDTLHETLFRPIDCEVDVETRTARVSIPGVLESTGTPIRSAATGEEHRVRIEIPQGIEFEVAEMGAGHVRANAAIQLDIANRYGQFNRLRHSGSGVVHS